MRIGLIHFKLGLKGGLESRLQNYISYFLEKGHEVDVICGRISGDFPMQSGFRIIKLGPGIYPKVFHQWAFSQKVKRHLLTGKYDLSFSLGRTEGQDIVLAPGNHLGYLQAMGLPGKRLKDRMQIRMDRLSFDSAKLILAASGMIREELIKMYGISADKIQLLYPPLDTGRFRAGLKAEQERLKPELGFSTAKTSCLFVSTGHHRKGLDILLKAFQILKEEPFELLIAGKPDPRSPLPNVRYSGFVAEPQSLYAAADLTLHPARYEPFGQIISESLACGTPVLISDKTGAKEVLGPNDGKVIASLSPEVWADEIRKAAKAGYKVDPDFARRNGLSREEHVERILQLWNALPKTELHPGSS
jgi:glycosyltransferase involved in cell wall biosynthesis